MVEKKLFFDEFLATVRTKDGKDYELDSFRVMVECSPISLYKGTGQFSTIPLRLHDQSC